METIQIAGRTGHYLAWGENGPIIYAGTGENGLKTLQDVSQGVLRLVGDTPFILVVYECEDWNRDYSPWPAPAVFGEAAFSGGGQETLSWLESCLLPFMSSRFPECSGHMLAGYSLAGLFSLWALYESSLFSGGASCSGSLWFPGWISYAAAHSVSGKRVYLSLGLKEEKTRNAVMAQVGDCTRRQYELLPEDGRALEWHPGGHFHQTDERLARGIAWLVKGDIFIAPL